jgi:hypothetical protein
MPRSDESKPVEQQDIGSRRDPKWDRKQGVPKDREIAKAVEKASGRYSASEQSEEKRSTEKH